MNHVIKRCLQASILAGGLWVVGQGIASADSVQAPVNAPVTVCGINIGILGGSSSGCPATTPDSSTSTAGSGDTSASAPINAPISVSGISLQVGQPAGSNTPPSGTTSSGSSATSGGATTPSGGLTANAPVNAPVTVCGISAGVLGNGSSGCPTAANSAAGTASSTSGTGGGSDTGLLGGLLGGGVSAVAPVNAPVTVCGISAGVLGDGSSACPATAAGTASSTSGTGSADPGTPGTGVLGVDTPITAPVNVCGIGVGVLGSGSSTCGGTDATTVTNPPGSPSSPNTPATPGRNPVAALLSDSAQGLAFTGSDIQSGLAVALGLLLGGGALARVRSSKALS
jgi:hypothetical protein